VVAAIFILPLARLKFAFNVNLATLLDVLANDLGKALKRDDLVPLGHAVDAKVGSAEWSGGFTSLLTRTKGAPLDTGTYPTTINGRTFPLTIVRVGEHTYQVSVDRRKPLKGA
jgi:hypothetical protein